MNESKPDINKVLFMHLVSMLAMSAIQQMGKLMDPTTGKAATNLEAAQSTIDMLDMLSIKTKNNLDADEEKLMKDTLSSLKMNFVETKDKEEQKPRETRDKPKESTPPAEDKPQDTTEPKSDKESPKDPQFHKSYN